MPRRPHSMIESMASILILGGVLPLAVALVSQYAFDFFPCHFCLLQRYPYAVVIGCGVGSLLVPHMTRLWKLCVAVGALAFFATGVLGLYHTGIERGWVAYQGGCVADTSVGQTLDDLRDQVFNAPRVSCSDAVLEFAGLSMASWNSLFAAGMIVLVLLQYREERRIHGQ